MTPASAEYVTCECPGNNKQIETHHVNNLLQGEAECEDEGLWLIVDRPLQLVVLLHQRVQQPPLGLAAVHAAETEQGDDEAEEEGRGPGLWTLHGGHASSQTTRAKHLNYTYYTYIWSIYILYRGFKVLS